MNETSQNVFPDAGFASDQYGYTGSCAPPEGREIEDSRGTQDSRNAFARRPLSEHRPAPLKAGELDKN